MWHNTLGHLECRPTVAYKILQDVAPTTSPTSPVPLLPSHVSFQPHWPPSASMYTPAVVLPQGLCTCRVLCLLPLYIRMAHIFISVKSFKFRLLSEACPYQLSLFFILELLSGVLNTLLRMSIVCLPVSSLCSLMYPQRVYAAGIPHGTE